MKWMCLICEKDLTPNNPHERGDDTRAILPNVAGGTITIDFGYGSIFDDMSGYAGRERIEHQACICDDCYKEKIHLIRAIETRSQSRFVTMSPGYRDRR